MRHRCQQLLNQYKFLYLWCFLFILFRELVPSYFPLVFLTILAVIELLLKRYVNGQFSKQDFRILLAIALILLFAKGITFILPLAYK